MIRVFLSFSVLLLAVAMPAAEAAMSAADVFQRVSRSVVVVRSSDPDTGGSQGSQGSGVVIGPETVITNAHVVSYSTDLSVEHDGEQVPAQVRYISVERDLCELHVPGLGAPAVDTVPLGDLQVGQTVYAVGAPKGLDLTLSQGLVSSIRTKGKFQLIQTSAAISRGSSGGGLFDDEGRLIGVTTLTVSDGQNLNFAVPADWIDELSESSLVSNVEEGRWFLQLYHHQRRKEFDAVARVAREWTAKYPENAYALAYQGDAFVLTGRYADAVRAYQEATTVEERSFEAFSMAAWKGLGDVAMKLHRYQEAVESYDRFIQRLEAHGELNDKQKLLVGGAHEMSARALTRLERYDEAVERQKKVAEAVPGSPAPPLNIARILRMKQDFTETLAWIDVAEKKAPGHANVLLERGITYLRMGRAGQALPQLEEACEAEPWNVHGLPFLAEAYLETGQRSEAKRTLERAAEELAGDPEVFRKLGLLQLEAKEFEAAAVTLRRALRARSRDVDLWKALAAASMRAKSYGEAAEAYRNALILDPEDLQGWFRLGVCLAKTKDYGASAEALERAVALRPGSDKLLYRLGMTYLAARDKGRVRSTLERLTRVDRRRAAALKRRALASPLFRR